MRCFLTSNNDNLRFKSTAAAASPAAAVTSPSSSNSAAVESSSQEQTPRSSAIASSPTTSTSTSIVDLTREYSIAVQTSSYNEIWQKMHRLDQSSSHLLDQVLHPDRDSIHQTLRRARPTNLTRLVSAYFDNSEHTSKLCLLLQRSIDRARALYAPLHDLLDLLPSNPSPIFSSQSQFDWVFATLSEFDHCDNPFPSDSNFSDIRICFSQLKLQLNRCLRKARRRVRVTRRASRCSAFCLVGAAVSVAISAVVIATHALAAIVVAPFFAFLPTHLAKQQLHHIAQLDAAARGTYVLNNDLDTIDRLVARLHATIESDKLLVRLGLERGKEMYPIQEVVKQLRKNQANFLHQLKDLEEHVCLYFAAVNRARSLLLQEIHLHQTRDS